MRVPGAIPLATLTLAGCLVEGEDLYDRVPPPEPRPDAGDPGGAGLDVPAWADARAVLARHCFECHGEPATRGAPYAFETYDEASYYAPRIVARVREGSMPPISVPPAPPAEGAVLARWLEAGTPP